MKKKNWYDDTPGRRAHETLLDRSESANGVADPSGGLDQTENRVESGGEWRRIPIVWLYTVVRDACPVSVRRASFVPFPSSHSSFLPPTRPPRAASWLKFLPSTLSRLSVRPVVRSLDILTTNVHPHQPKRIYDGAALFDHLVVPPIFPQGFSDFCISSTCRSFLQNGFARYFNFMAYTRSAPALNKIQL